MVRPQLTGRTPHVELLARDEKAGRGARIPLRADLVADLREWLEDKLQEARADAKLVGRAVPLVLPLDAPLFTVPRGLVKMLDHELAAAGVAKRGWEQDGRPGVSVGQDAAERSHSILH